MICSTIVLPTAYILTYKRQLNIDGKVFVSLISFEVDEADRKCIEVQNFSSVCYLCNSFECVCLRVCVFLGIFFVDGDSGKQELPFIIQILCNVVHIE